MACCGPARARPPHLPHSSASSSLPRGAARCGATSRPRTWRTAPRASSRRSRRSTRTWVSAWQCSGGGGRGAEGAAHRVKAAVRVLAAAWPHVVPPASSVGSSPAGSPQLCPPRARQVREINAFKGLDQSVKNFLVSVPLVADLRSPAMRPRHWHALMDATGVGACQAARVACQGGVGWAAVRWGTSHSPPARHAPTLSAPPPRSSLTWLTRSSSWASCWTWSSTALRRR
jgi:hypothetical protein